MHFYCNRKNKYVKTEFHLPDLNKSYSKHHSPSPSLGPGCFKIGQGSVYIMIEPGPGLNDQFFPGIIYVDSS